MGEKFKQSWFIRRLIYAVISVGGVVLFALGMMTPEAFDATVEQAGPAITLVVSAVTALASRKANPGSDTQAKPTGPREVPYGEFNGHQGAKVNVQVPTLDDLRRTMGQ